MNNDKKLSPVGLKFEIIAGYFNYSAFFETM